MCHVGHECLLISDKNAFVLLKVLKQIQERHKNPALPPIHLDCLWDSGKLYFPEKLYGREEEVTTIIDEIMSVKTRRKSKSITIISGVSGIGKTHIVLDVRELSIGFLLTFTRLCAR